ncbi:MAG: O-antigen ligase family protein, partial [Parvibaculum sp.]
LNLVMWGGVCLIAFMPLLISIATYFLLETEVASHMDMSMRITVLSRLDLWAYVAGLVWEAPWFGYGLEAGRFIPIDQVTFAYFSGNAMHHPHNGLLQIWFELGAFGAMAAIVGWVALVRSLGRQSISSRRFLLAGLSNFIVIGSVSHGLWQSWWVSALVLIPFLYSIALSLNDVALENK